MKRLAILTLAVLALLVSCGKPNSDTQPDDEHKDALVGTSWWAPDGGTMKRFLKFPEKGKLTITFSDDNRRFDGTYQLNGSNITFVGGWELLVHSGGLNHTYRYSFKTGVIEGNKMKVNGVIVSDTSMDGQEFTEEYTKQ